MEWFHGKIPDGTTFLGITFFWIGRLAKLLEFTSGSVIILDWIGPKTLTTWANKLEAWLRIRHEFLNFFKWRMFNPASVSHPTSLPQYTLKNYVVGQSLWMIFAVCLFYLNKFAHVHESVGTLRIAIGWALAAVTLISEAIAVLGLVPLLMYWLAVITAWHISGAIKLVDRNEDDPKRPIVGIACICLLIGFALDFITS